MAVDIQDFTQAVIVQGGSVTITGIASVSISGTPTVNINAGQSVSISGTPNVVISGTPSVSISGTPTVILGGGTASIGSISAIGSTVTVAGTINIGNTPAVTISGTPNVNISSGTVSISSGTINVQTLAATSIQISPQVQGLQTFTARWLYQTDQGGHTIIAGVIGQTIKLYQVAIAVTLPKPRGAVVIQSTDLAVILNFSGDTTEEQVIDYHGLAFPVGIGLQYLTTSVAFGGGIEFSLTLQYTQA